VKEACKNFLMAADKGHPKAFYQLAKMQQKGIPGMKKDVATAAALYKVVAERGPWSSLMRWALECYLKGQIGKALLLYSRAAELGYEAAQSNAAWILEKYHGEGICLGKSGLCTDMERHKWAHMLWHYASEQGNEHAALLIGDTYFYGRGTEKDLDRAAAAYTRAQSQQNAQAMFNLGYMYEHGLGLPKDLHLAKRHYDQALDTEPAAALPVTLALAGLWLRQHYGESFIVKAMDSLPETAMKVGDSFMGFFVDEGNVTLVTLFICLLTVLYMRQRQRRTMPVNIRPPPQ
jgi:SEL1 protein